MYAIIDFGGKQYKVEEGQTLITEKVNGVEAGSEFVFDKVIFFKNDAETKVGKPFIEGGKVTAEVVEHGKDRKIKILKFKGRKNFRKRKGHRQLYTELKIKTIEA
ncbi:50S ribosomal protein L21 [Oceanotoga sp. DSM 15011]|uniref:Large ribosomal subunit protein bL21 n=1 Tax=Oceanotoga teriensis TaxID=515440 RepID=A0AA45C639_9BACT|nr:MULTISPECIES: 50S ribosomal protein L21 [Oceanotoga]MDO7975662.1 50S ribosomal protein L21 [Oceanotoga teriensis]PWJ90589.1 LSU ribosomal protein L21P [Oceanotoga teriensis]UYO99834.1 50S ribosomal protein L21 [Oceanotoga sp. DSM 15011]